MRTHETNEDGSVIALQALVWVLGDPLRAQRLLDLTGISPDSLRGRLDDPAMLDAVLAFLESHEPDLIACAEALGHKPEALVAARRELF
jgi:Protein of unknown function (DUF3572)